jgi:DNA-binding Lrp family transcriptional regulator
MEVIIMSVKAYIMMNIKSGSEDEVCEKLLNYDEIEEVSTIYGEFDVIAKVKAVDMNSLDNLIVKRLRSIPDIILTATMLIAREFK